MDLGRCAWIAAACCLCAPVCGTGLRAQADQPVSGLPTAPSFSVRQATEAIRIDGVLDEGDWQRAEPIALAWEWLPGDNVAPPVETTCRVTFDQRNLLLGCHAADPRPDEIRAHYADRDDRTRLPQDDHVIFLIDPFNDERRAFQFRVNAAGVQMDAVLSTAEGFEDFSWDAIWASAARITEEGYEVEVAIPFRSLRFPQGDGPQTWGFIISRSYPRNFRHRIRSAPTDRNNRCLLCQANKVTGFQGMSPGRNVEGVPTLTARRTDERTPFPDGSFEPTTQSDLADVDPDFGLDLRWGVTPNMSLNATYNPDFSQIEADAAQLDINTRFALFFPEKRPFFLEGADFFQTPIQAAFTRTLANPDGGLKLTGKDGRNAIGVFAARDAFTSLLFPGNQSSSAGFIDQEAYMGVARYRRDIGQSSYVGGLYTGRGGRDYQNHVYGADTFYQLSPSNTARVQYVRSSTEYPDTIAGGSGQPTGSFDGGAFSAQLQHFSRNWLVFAQYEDRSPRFRADAGFVTRVDTRNGGITAGRIFWGRQGSWFSRIQILSGYDRTEDHTETLTDQSFFGQINYQGPSQSVVALGGSRLTQVFLGTEHDMIRGNAFFQIRPSGSVTLAASAQVGDFVDFTNNRKSYGLILVPNAQLSLARNVQVNVNHELQRLSFGGQEVFTATLTQGRVIYHFGVRTFLRAIMQYRRVRRDPNQYAVPVSTANETLLSQFLFSYKVNPRTVWFLGYSSDHVGADDFSFQQRARTLFTKIGYAWRP